MNKQVYELTNIETLLFDKMVEVGFMDEFIFMSNRPTSIDDKADSFLVIRSSTNIQDLDAIGTGILSVAFYAKNVRSLRNSKKLSEMYASIVSALPFKIDNFSFRYQNVTPSYSDGIGFHYQIVNIRLLINQ